MDFSHYRRGTPQRRSEGRMHVNQISNRSDYTVMLTASQ